jgi:peptide/nickel transport system substrate-binding protein
MMARVRWVVGPALVAMTAAGCGMGGNGQAAGTAAGGGHLVYDEFSAPVAAWALESDDAQIFSRAGCPETLTRNTADGTLIPWLAESWTRVSPTVWKFTLRKDVKFQDGTVMDAQAVAGALNHLLQAKVPARSFNPKSVSAVQAVDAGTVQITTPAPDVLLPLRTASPNTAILAPKAYEGQQLNIQGTCTGPFKVVKEVPGQSLQVVRSDGYWGGKPALAGAEVRFVAAGPTRVTQIRTGEADVSSVVPAVSVSALQGDSNVKLEKIQSPRTAVMLLNNSRPPFNNPAVRKAVQRALDTSAIAKSIYHDVATPAAGPFAPTDPWAPQGSAPITASLDEAKSMLAQAGVKPGSLTFTLVAYTDRPEFADLAAVIQDQLAKIGVKVKIKTGSNAAVQPDLLAGNFDAALFSRGYLIDAGDPLSYLRSDWSCKGTFNIAHYCDPQTDALIDKAAGTEDANARHQIEGQIAQKVQDDAGGVFLVHESLVTAVRSRVQGFKPDPRNFFVLTKDLAVR